jgi:stage II sporulation protein E
MQKPEKPKTAHERATLFETAVLIGGFLCALLLSRIRIQGVYMPLSMGLLLGCRLAGGDPAAIAGGILLGAFAGFKPAWQDAATALLFWTITQLIPKIRKEGSKKHCLLIWLLSGILTMPLSAIGGWQTLPYAALSLVTATVSALCWQSVFRTIGTMNRARILADAEQAAIVIGIGLLLLSVSDMAFAAWSLPVTLILLLGAAAVYVRGVSGAAAGILWTVMLTLYKGPDAGLSGSAALGMLLAAALRERGKPFIIGAFFASGLLFQTYRDPQAYALSAPNLIAGSLLFSLLPKTWLNTLRQYADPGPFRERMMRNAVKRTEQRASLELARMGKLLGGFSGMFHVAEREEDTVERWTVQGALVICRGCELRRLCWKDADAMRDAILTLAEQAKSGMRVTPVGPIDACCRHFSDFCASVLLSYQQAQNRNAVSRQAQAQSGFVERQFSGAGAALCSFARRIQTRSPAAAQREARIAARLAQAGYTIEALDLYEADGMDTIALSLRRPLHTKHSAVRRALEQAYGCPLRCLRVAQSERFVSFRFEQDAALHVGVRVSRNPAGGAVSGDATGECRIPGGRVCFALSDGMGRGRAARRESEAAIRLLFRLWHAGVAREMVYENVNRMLLAQNETDMYATLDAVSIDLNTGEAEVLKYGAPPSFLVREGRVSTIAGEALPCGILAEASPSVIRLTLRKNDRIVLCSDGVQDAFGQETEAAIQSIENEGLRTGEQLLRMAKARGGEDDMTVMVIRVA